MSGINGWVETAMKLLAFLGLACFGFGWVLEALINTENGLSINSLFNYKYVISGALYLVFILTPPLLMILIAKSFYISLNYFYGNLDVGAKFSFEYKKVGFKKTKTFLLFVFLVLLTISLYVYPLLNVWKLFLGVDADVSVLSIYEDVISISYVSLWLVIVLVFFEWNLKNKIKDYMVVYAVGMLCLSIVPYSISVNSNIPSNFGGSKTRTAMIFPNDELAKQLESLGYEISKNKSIIIVIMAENDRGILIGSKISGVKSTFLKWDVINSISFLK